MNVPRAASWRYHQRISWRLTVENPVQRRFDELTSSSGMYIAGDDHRRCPRNEPRPVKFLDVGAVQCCYTFCGTPVRFGVTGPLSVQKGLEALVRQRARLSFYLQYFGEPFRLQAL